MLTLQNPWHNIGPTPLIKIRPGLYAKLETVNPTGSIKDRPMQMIVSNAINSGAINSESSLVEASSGNTGISLCALGAALGITVKIIMPSNMSEERRQMMRAFGGEIIEVGASDFEAAIKLRNKMIAENENYWSPMQFENNLNVECHRTTTGAEIIDQLPKSTRFSAFVSGAGTGGTIMGVREAIIDMGLDTHVCLVVPSEPAHDHGIQGIGDGQDFLVNPDLMDVTLKVSTKQAKARADKVAKEMGLLVGVSSGANLVAAETYIHTFKPKGSVVTILCDRGERYLCDGRKA